MESSQTIKKIYTLISESHNILLISHRNPDGDTLGSTLALTRWLKKIEKTYTIYCQNKPADFLSFLPDLELIKTKEPNLENYDLIIACDCADQEQAGLNLKNTKTPVINIDHHLTNTNYGDYNLVLPQVASTTVILFQLFTQNTINLDRHIATCLLTGLIGDTGNFSNLSTSGDSLEIASRLVAKGARIRDINRYLIKNKSVRTLKLWSRIFLRLNKNEELSLAWTVITLKDKEECKVDDQATEGISNFFNELADANFTLVLEEIIGGYVKGSLRTTTNTIDVSKFAKIMGGGGHQRAAGFRLKGKLEEVGGGWSIV